MSDTLTRVLYVDDEPHIRTLAQLSLERVGGLVTCICDSGRSAVAAAPAVPALAGFSGRSGLRFRWAGGPGCGA